MRTLQATLCTALLLSTAGAHANNIWVVNLTDKPIQSATFLIFHKNSKAEIVGSLTSKGNIEKKEFKSIAPWAKTDGQSIDSTLSKLVVGKRGSKLCDVSINDMDPSETIYIQGNPYQKQFLFDCKNTSGLAGNLIVWGDCTLIVENDPTLLEKGIRKASRSNKKVSFFKMKIENNTPLESKYLQAKNDAKPIIGWDSKTDNALGRFKKKIGSVIGNKENSTNQ